MATIKPSALKPTCAPHSQRQERVMLPAVLPADRVAKKGVVGKADVHTNKWGPICCHHLPSNHTRVAAQREGKTS